MNENNKQQPFILSTPILFCKDAEKIILSSMSEPNAASIERNLFEYSILKKIRKRVMP